MPLEPAEKKVMAKVIAPYVGPLPTIVNETPQIAAVRTMYELLQKRDFANFYQDWCHPHIKKPLTENEFVEYNKAGRGSGTIQILRDVVLATAGNPSAEYLSEKLNPDTQEYAFRVKGVAKHGTQWHLELQLHEGKWKLMDTD